MPDEKTPSAPAPDQPKTVTVEAATDVPSHQVSEVLVKLHDQAKKELGAAEAYLVEVQHEIGTRVRALFRAGKPQG